MWLSYRCGVICFLQAEDGIRDLVRSRGLGDVYKRQAAGSRGERHGLDIAGVAGGVAGVGDDGQVR